MSDKEIAMNLKYLMTLILLGIVPNFAFAADDQSCYSVQIQYITQEKALSVLPSLSYPAGCKLMNLGNDYIVRCGCFETYKKSQASLKELKKVYSEAYITKTYKAKFDEKALKLIDSNVSVDLNTSAESLVDSNKTDVSVPLLSNTIDSNATDSNNSKIDTKLVNFVTLQDAVKTSIESNFRVKQAKERIKQADQMVREAQGDFLPQVTLSADAMRRKNNGFDVQDYSQGEYGAVLSYNLFSSGKHLAQYNKNKIVKKEQEEKYKGTVQEEINKLIDAYCSVVYGKLAVEVNKRNYDKLIEVYEIVKKKRELGAATNGDESSISASVSNAKTAMTNTESAYNNAKDYYEFLIDKKMDQLTPYEQGFDIKVDNFEKIFDEIKTNNTDLNIIRAHIDEKRKDLLINKASDLPSLDLTLSDTRRYRKDFGSKPLDGGNSDLLGQITLTYNLYTGGKTQAKTARIMSETTDNIYDLEYTTKQTKWDSQKLYNSVITNTKTLTTLSSEISESQKMTDAYWERFRLASQDLVILLQAQRQVNTAELEKLKSEKTRIIDYFNLLTKQGKLLEYFGY